MKITPLMAATTLVVQLAVIKPQFSGLGQRDSTGLRKFCGVVGDLTQLVSAPYISNMGKSLEYENIDKALARRLAALRRDCGLSLDQAAELSGVSRATLSRTERAETSPTAHFLGRLSAAYGITLSALLGGLDEAASSVLSRDHAGFWNDPETGLRRWSISPPARGYDIELIWAELPAGARIEYPSPPYWGMEQHIVLFEGALNYEMGDTIYSLQPNDSLRIKLCGASALESCGLDAAKYLVAVRSSQ